VETHWFWYKKVVEGHWVQLVGDDVHYLQVDEQASQIESLFEKYPEVHDDKH
jgi:hypothetical protein